MNLKEKENKSLQDKLRHYFRKGKSGSGSFRRRIDFALTPEIEKELSAENAVYKRLRVIKDLNDEVLGGRLEDKTVHKLWLCVEDLLNSDQPKENRHIVFNFLRSLIQGQYEQLNAMMRSHVFRVLKEHKNAEDAQLRFELLQSLTDNGKDIKYFEEEIGEFMLQWMSTITNAILLQEFLTMLVNLIKYNAAHLDMDVVSGYVNHTCYLCCYSAVPQVVLVCLQVLECIVGYSIFPHETLHTFVSALCRTVNVEQYCQPSWKIMRNVLGTDLGHAALHAMCSALNNSPCQGLDAGLVRGAVFYLNMALWGAKRVTSLKCTPTSVLPSFLRALDGNQSVVTYEVILAMQSLVNKHGQELHEPAWDLIFSILVKIITQIEDTTTPYPLTVSHLHETISTIEQLHECKQFYGCTDSMYNMIDKCANSRPEPSVIALMEHKISRIGPTRGSWLEQLAAVLEKHLRHETRRPIRLHALKALHVQIQLHRYSYEEDLLDRVVLPNLQHCASEADPIIRCASAKILIDLALNCQSKRCVDILDILEKLLNRPFTLYVTSEPIDLSPDTDISDIKAVVSGLVDVFLVKLYQLPSSHAIKIYHILAEHLKLHYNKPSLFQNHPFVRIKILELFLSARVNSSHHIGFSMPLSNGRRPAFSPYICVEGTSIHDQAHRGVHSATHSPTTLSNHQANIMYVSIRKACNLIVVCLNQEQDWSILQLVLKEIPNVLQNKALVLSKHGNDINQLASTLCSLVDDSHMSHTRNFRVTPGVKLSDLHMAVLTVLSSLAPYHMYLDPQIQQRIVKCVYIYGLVSCSPQQCIAALTIFTLEMRDTIVKLAPEVLLNLSKVSATVHIAVPMLEFLSTLTRLPKVFASFTGKQYMSVFAILLYYTNPSRYNHYVVSLAHHIIAAWFLKCRLCFRREFVTYIIKGLKNSINQMSQNEDSSNRKRSSSLTEKGSRHQEKTASSDASRGFGMPLTARSTFHVDLTETCIDLMSRHTFSPCNVQPKRLPSADFLFSGGQSMTWLVGHKLITVTTSGCLQNSLKQGLCDRCLVLCKQHTESFQSPSPLIIPGMVGSNLDANSDRGEGLLQTTNHEFRRYAKYSFQHSRSSETTYSSTSISDNVLCPPTLASGQTTRQNSSENKSGSETTAPASPRPLANSEAENVPPVLVQPSQPSQPVTSPHLSLRLETLASKQSSEDRSSLGLHPRLERILCPSSNKASGMSSGYCMCWCSGWAEIHIRRPTGDVSWVMRIQNQMNFDSSVNEFPLNDIAALLAPSLYPVVQRNAAPPSSSDSSCFGDSRNDILSDVDPRSRSGSTASQLSQQGGLQLPQPLHHQSMDSAKYVEELNQNGGSLADFKSTLHISTNAFQQQLRSTAGTGPIAIPGSPQRQTSSSTTTDEDDEQNNGEQAVDVDDQGKSRHPVRRSNSSPEMSSSWKNPFHVRERVEAAVVNSTAQPNVTNHLQMTNNNGCQDNHDTDEFNNTYENSTMQLHQKKVIKSILAKDMRVSCEAIPEEMYGATGNTPPHHQQPHLMSYKSDPGTTKSSNTATNTITTSMSTHTMTQVLSEQNSNITAPKLLPIEISKNGSKNESQNNSKSQEMMKLIAKPPQSPAPASPRPPNRPLSTNRIEPLRNSMNLNLKLIEKQNLYSSNLPPVDDLPPMSRSKRSATFSVMSEARKGQHTGKFIGENLSPKRRDGSRLGGGGGGGVSPAFVLVQLFHNAGSSGLTNILREKGGDRTGGTGPSGSIYDKPLLISEPQHERSVKNLDTIPPLETYRVGVLYVGPGQHDNETKILKNEFGSLRYAEFLKDLGTLIALEDAEKYGLFLNVEKGGKDGHFAYVWQDDIMQVQFHVATLMPNKPTDPECNEKRKHIGNDFVSIVYNESGENFQIQTIKGQFNFCIVVIEPLDHGINRVTIKTKDERIEKEFLKETDAKIISDQNVALLARQWALHCTLASHISRSLNTKGDIINPYASNSLERLRIIKRLRKRLIDEKTTASESTGIGFGTNNDDAKRNHNFDNFTEYT